MSKLSRAVIASPYFLPWRWFLPACGAAALLCFARSIPVRCLLAGALLVWFVLTRAWERKRARAQADLLAQYIVRMPDLPTAAPAVTPELLPIVDATGHAALSVRSQLHLSGASRQQLEALLEGMQDAVVGLDSAGRVQWSNGNMQRLLYRDAAGAMLRQGRPLVHTFRDPVLLSAVQRTLEAATPTECRSDAVLLGRVFRVNASPLPDGGAVVVLHDTTQAEQMERSQRDFVANVSHELRTPLTSIIGYVETVMDNEALTSPAMNFLGTALKNASRMQRLTEDLLLISQTEQADKPLLLQALPVRTLLEDALRTVQGAAYAERAELEIIQCAPDEVMADAHAVSQVLGNLLENAVKYSQQASTPSSLKVLLSAEVVPHEPPYMEIRVKDSGPGIALEHLSRIFDRFYRVEKARSREVGGTGLGLSIARTLVQQHGGRIWAESALGEGSTFCFTLPLAN